MTFLDSFLKDQESQGIKIQQGKALLSTSLIIITGNHHTAVQKSRSLGITLIWPGAVVCVLTSKSSDSSPIAGRLAGCGQ